MGAQTPVCALSCRPSWHFSAKYQGNFRRFSPTERTVRESCAPGHADGALWSGHAWKNHPLFRMLRLEPDFSHTTDHHAGCSRGMQEDARVQCIANADLDALGLTPSLYKAGTMEDYWGIQIVPHGLHGPQATVYTTRVRQTLAGLARTPSGRALLSSLRYWRDRSDLGILPFPAGGCNAQTASDGADEPTVAVYFSPDHHQRRRGCHGAGASGNAVLYHELVHALRHASRKHAKQRLAGVLLPYTNTEEFYAVVATNVYLSELRQPLRAAYNSLTLEQALRGSFTFFASGHRIFGLIDRFCQDHPGFTRLLAAVRTPFNPFAAYYQDKQRAMQLSLGTGRDAAHFDEDFFSAMELRHLGIL